MLFFSQPYQHLFDKPMTKIREKETSEFPTCIEHSKRINFHLIPLEQFSTITVENNDRLVMRHADRARFVFRKRIYQSVLLQILCAPFGFSPKKYHREPLSRGFIPFFNFPVNTEIEQRKWS